MNKKWLLAIVTIGVASSKLSIVSASQNHIKNIDRWLYECSNLALNNKEVVENIGGKDLLRNAVRELEALNNADYINLEIIKPVLSEAYTVLANSNATQEQIEDVLADIDSVKARLIRVGNKVQLQELIEQVESLEPTDYENWGIIEEPYNEAQVVMEDERATQDRIDEAAENLNEAINNLVNVRK